MNFQSTASQPIQKNIDQYKDGETFYKFPVSKVGLTVPRCVIEPLWKNGIVTKLYISFESCSEPEYFNQIFQLDLNAAEILFIEGESLAPIIQYNKERKTQTTSFKVYGKFVTISRANKCFIEVKS